jgi:predicted transcriptional regulator
MRTTVDLPAPLLARAKELAAARRSTLSEVVAEALAAYEEARRHPSKDPPFELIVRGRKGARFPTPEEMAAAIDDEDAAALRIPGSPRRAGP